MVLDKAGRQLCLHIDVIGTSDQKPRCSIGPRRVLIYVPYWLFDMTDLGLVVSENKKDVCPGMLGSSRVPGFDTQLPQTDASYNSVTGASLRRACMFSFSESSRKKQVFCRTSLPAVSNWSIAFALDQIASAAGAFSMESSDGALYEVCVSISAGPGNFHRTAFVTLSPRFMFVNKFATTTDVRQFSRLPSPDVVEQELKETPFGIGVDSNAHAARDGVDSVLSLGSGTVAAFHWPHGRDRRYVSFRVHDVSREPHPGDEKYHSDSGSARTLSQLDLVVQG